MVDLKLDYGKDFLKEEVRCDYTIDSEMKRIWAVELDLVNELKRVCDKYGIQYFADGGTLLGAIRHKGFIPWDNDIDLCMFPLDPRQGGLFDAGINHFVMSVKPRVVIPMHWQQRAEVPLNYARRGRTRYTEILALTKPRERADITFGEDELQIHVHTPVTGLFEEKKESEPLEERKDDPFTDTDLPVNVK